MSKEHCFESSRNMAKRFEKQLPSGGIAIVNNTNSFYSAFVLFWSYLSIVQLPLQFLSHDVRVSGGVLQHFMQGHSSNPTLCFFSAERSQAIKIRGTRCVTRHVSVLDTEGLWKQARRPARACLVCCFRNYRESRTPSKTLDQANLD